MNYWEISCTSYSIIIIYDEAILYFFGINFSKRLYFFAFWQKKIRRHLVKCCIISGVLQGLVKICKKYIEVNLFLLLSCTTLILKYS